MTVDDESAEITVPWFWGRVPGAGVTEAERDAWADEVVGMFQEWTRDGWDDQFRLWWLAEGGQTGDYPFTGEVIGRAVARWLTERAGTLPPWQRLAWGTAFVQGWPRWSPVPVVVEYRAPVADDPIYLMDVVGAGAGPDDEAAPEAEYGRQVEYVTTPYGDGLRVLSLRRTDDDLAYGQLEAAMRLDWPAAADRPAARLDVLLATRLVDLQLLALIGPGVETLMQQIAEHPHRIAAPPTGNAMPAGQGEQTAPSQIGNVADPAGRARQGVNR